MATEARKYKVDITETLQRSIEVEAESISDAISIAQEMYDKSEIVLDDTEYAKDIGNNNTDFTLEELQKLLDEKEYKDELDITEDY